MNTWNDVGIVVLDEPIAEITPAQLAPTNHLNRYVQPKLNSTLFRLVGYGTEVRKPVSGPQKPTPMSYPIERRYTDVVGQKLTPQILQVNGNEHDTRGGGGSCFGDSGGPSFIDGYLVTVTSYGYTSNCRYIDGTAAGGHPGRPVVAGRLRGRASSLTAPRPAGGHLSVAPSTTMVGATDVSGVGSCAALSDSWPGASGFRAPGRVDYRAIVASLAEAHAVVCFDTPGGGLSDRTAPLVDRRRRRRTADHHDRAGRRLAGRASPFCSSIAGVRRDSVRGPEARPGQPHRGVRRDRGGPRWRPDQLRRALLDLLCAHRGLGSRAISDLFVRGIRGEELE